ncbi:efflux transporter outer membrane subunit [Rubrivivax sp. RP6-9]|uniref:efflux transporter outer membrane subunit n=1 Tax=Rubrivivax sp. RP6-9 TaxID=3415750 RepID=UPI003CC65EA3
MQATSRFAPPTPRGAARLALLALALLAGGCASLQQAPAAAPADPTPSAWTGAAVPATTPSDLAAWWSQFGDPQMAPLVQAALQQQTDITTAQARLRQARAARALAGAQLAPTMNASGSAQASANEGSPRTQRWSAGLDAGWEADLWGAGAAGVRAADATLAASALTLAHTRVSVAAEVALTLLELRGTQARTAIAERNLASQQQTLQIVQWRHEAGLVTQLDVAQARTAVEQTRAQLPALAGSAAQSMHALAVLTGQAPGALQAQLATPVPLPAAPPALALAIPAEVLRQRPDVQAAERRLQAAAARVDEADAARLPSLSLSGSIGLNALRLSALGSGAGAASLLAGVNLPLFDGGRLRAQVQSQEAARDEAAVAWRATVLAALQEVEDALVGLRAAREQLAAQQAAAASAQTAATLADQRYRSGLVDFTSVLQSQRTLLSAEDSVAGTSTALATAHVRLVKALGGGWNPDEPTDTSTNTPR